MNYTQESTIPDCLKDYLLLDTRNINHARQAAERSFVPHELSITGAKSDFHFMHSQAPLRDVSLCFTRYGSELKLEPERLRDFYLIQMPFNGRIEVKSDDQKVCMRGMQGSIVSPDKSIQMKWAENSGILTIKLDRQALEEQLRRLNQSEVKDGIEFDLNMCLTAPEYRNWYIEVMRLMQYFQYSKRTELVSLEGWFEQKLMEILLTSQPNNYSADLLQNNFQAPSKSVGRAIDFMHEHLDQKITLAQLATVTGVTARTLHNGFRRYRNVSPMEYLTDIRLHKARGELKRANGETSITSIAQSAGFTHLGRFSQRYNLQFGERPSDTVRNNRRHNA